MGVHVCAVCAEAGEKERASMIESLKVCDVKHADMHQLQWMLSERCAYRTRTLPSCSTALSPPGALHAHDA